MTATATTPMTTAATLARQDHDSQDAAVQQMRAMLTPTDTATQMRTALSAPFAYPLPIPDAVQDRIRKAMMAEGIGRNGLRGMGRAPSQSQRMDRVAQTAVLLRAGATRADIARRFEVSDGVARQYVAAATRKVTATPRRPEGSGLERLARKIGGQ